jgi:hypothetical protein
MAVPPYERQGQPLNEALGVKGEWVEFAHVFLFLPPPEQSFTQIGMAGQACFGFNAHVLAENLQTNASDLILNNRLGNLAIRWEETTPSRGAAKTFKYFFLLQPFGAEAVATVSTAPIGGHA